MSVSIYLEKLIRPDDQMLSKDLAETKKLLDKISEYIEKEYNDFKPEWAFYSKKSGWILKMLTKKRNVLFVVPCQKHFRAVFTFGEKATELIFQSELPDSFKQELHNAKKYAEGRTIQIEVHSENDLEIILKMIRIKLMT